ncbi:unnamed protein product, partial [Rotaria magnacalcarata]
AASTDLKDVDHKEIDSDDEPMLDLEDVQKKE